MSRSVAPAHYRSGGFVGFIGDILRGAILGDFAADLGLPGALTQVILAFTPGIGDICAVRDIFGNLFHRDGLGFLLNVLALVPVLGGIAKLFDVIHHTRRVGEAYVRSRNRSRQRAALAQAR